MEKKRPTYSLSAFQKASEGRELAFTSTALQSAASLGLTRSEIREIIQTMEDKHFYKSMTAHQSSQVWQDVYKVPSELGLLYIKFTSEVVAEFKVLSFKEA